jgi:hypothetical protein
VELLLCVALAVSAVQCRSRRAPDTDGLPTGAQNLPLETSRNDQLHCIRGDCADWYRLNLSQRGDLSVEVTVLQQTLASQDLFVGLADERARYIDEGVTQGAGSVTVGSHAQKGIYLVSVRSLERSKSPLAYQIIARFQKWVPPVIVEPEPRFETLTSEVLEVERDPGEEDAVLLGHGSEHGVLEGLRGRLINGETPIVEIEIVDVYPRGSRARLLGSLKQPIDPSTVAEISIPVSGSRP